MINKQRTIELFGYDPDILKPKSGKRVVANCDNCGRERIIFKFSYAKLCRSCSKSGKNHPLWGTHHTEEHKMKISVSMPDNRGENNPRYGKHLTKETKQKMSDTHTHMNQDIEIYTKICLNCGEEFSVYLYEKETRKFCCHNCYVVYSVGENSSGWKGGISFIKYCKLFNTSFKQKIRDKYHNKCFLCGRTKKENKQDLSVHHVNYNKDCLCGLACEFVPLCRSCHSKTNGNRQYWEDLIMNYLYPDKYFIIDI